MSNSQNAKKWYSDLTKPALKAAINLNGLSAIKLALLVLSSPVEMCSNVISYVPAVHMSALGLECTNMLYDDEELLNSLHVHDRLHALKVSEFAQKMADAHESFSKEIHSLVVTFRQKNRELLQERTVDTPSTIQNAWEGLLQVTSMDAQAHVDAANLFIKNVYKPLEEVATHKESQSQKLHVFRENLESILRLAESKHQAAEQEYINSYNRYRNCGTLDNREQARADFHNAHNEYIFQIQASNQIIDEFAIAIPQVLEEMEEIYIDTTNTINVAIESHSLLLLTKANEQQNRFEDLLKVCRQVNPQLDVSHFVKAVYIEGPCYDLEHHCFKPCDPAVANAESYVHAQLIIDRYTEGTIREKRLALQKEALELASYIKQNQEVTNALVNICQRNLANHLYAKVYETQEDMCRKRNEIRIANMQLGSVRSQIELLMPKQNGSLDEDQENKKNPSIIRGMWKKAFKSLKGGGGEKLSKKGSLHKKKTDSIEQDEPQCQSSGPVDPVYSLLKCAADLPKVGKPPCSLHASCTLHSGPGSIIVSSADSSDNTSKTSSHSSSASHSPKARRKKLNARMKSFSLDTPEPPKQLLGIDESTKKKSSSFTNTCFGGGPSPEDKIFSASSLRKKFASLKASSLEMEERKNRSYSPSPKESPKSQKKQMNLYVALYNFKAKEKDDMDLTAGMRINVTNSSKKDWWKGKSLNGKCGYFPATYVIPLQDGQRVFQVQQPLNLTDGYFGVKFHKDQIVLQVGEEVDGFIMVRAANNRQAMCPLIYLQEL